MHFQSESAVIGFKNQYFHFDQNLKLANLTLLSLEVFLEAILNAIAFSERRLVVACRRS